MGAKTAWSPCGPSATWSSSALSMCADLKCSTSAAFAKAMISGMSARPLGRPIAYYVDDDKVGAAKKEAVDAEGGVPFVSTNDVLTSHFLRACNVRMAMMTINYRAGGRWPAIADGLDAGNYEAIVLSDPGGHGTPATVRRSLTPTTEGAYTGVTMPYPGFFGECPCAFISTWASVGTKGSPFNITAGGLVEQQLHLPVINMGPFSKSPFDIAIIFRALPTRLAVLYIAKRGGPDELLEETTTVLGDPISTAMFPASVKA